MTGVLFIVALLAGGGLVLLGFWARSRPQPWVDPDDDNLLDVAPGPDPGYLYDAGPVYQGNSPIPVWRGPTPQQPPPGVDVVIGFDGTDTSSAVMAWSDVAGNLHVVGGWTPQPRRRRSGLPGPGWLTRAARGRRPAW